MDKIKTGIKGLDMILKGGYPKGRPSLLKAGPGSGKTIFCLLFANQCIASGHHVSFVTCDESPEMLIQNMDNMGLNGQTAVKSGHLHFLDFRNSLSDTVIGDFELSPVLMRIQNSLKGKHPILILDSLDNLFLGLESKMNELVLLQLFNWSRANSVTLLCTAVEGFVPNSDYSCDEYATDCVIHLEQQVRNTLMTRFLRILKYRGSHHGTNQYPYLITGQGVSIFPITNSLLREINNRKKISTGIKQLDDMLGGGYIQASSLMISGESGTAKSILLSKLAEKAISQKKKVLYFSYEEASPDFIANVKSVGIDLWTGIEKKLLTLKTARAVEMGLEEHLITIIETIEQIQPKVLIIDPVTSFLDLGSAAEVKSLLIRFISHLKSQNVTVILGELLKSGRRKMEISSLVDTWLMLTLELSNGEVNRTIRVIKSRGNASSNQVKEFFLSDKGITIQDPYIGQGKIVFGSEKNQQIILDKQAMQTLKAQLAEVYAQLERLDTYKKNELTDTEIHKTSFRFELLDKKRQLEIQLKNIRAIEQINKNSRGH